MEKLFWRPLVQTESPTAIWIEFDKILRLKVVIEAKSFCDILAPDCQSYFSSPTKLENKRIQQKKFVILRKIHFVRDG